MNDNERQMLFEELNKIWKDTEMTNYCIKKCKYLYYKEVFIECCDSKPPIYRTLWYNDTQKDPGESYNVFMEYNTDMNMPRLKDPKREHILIPQYCDHRNIKIYSCVRKESLSSIKLLELHKANAIIELDKNDIAIINETINEVIMDYTKRLAIYYKKYKDKIMSMGYWADR